MTQIAAIPTTDLTPQEREFLAMVKHGLQANRKECATGELVFRAIVRDGGIVDKYEEITTRHKGGRRQ